MRPREGKPARMPQSFQVTGCLHRIICPLSINSCHRRNPNKGCPSHLATPRHYSLMRKPSFQFPLLPPLCHSSSVNQLPPPKSHQRVPQSSENTTALQSDEKPSFQFSSLSQPSRVEEYVGELVITTRCSICTFSSIVRRSITINV